MIEMQYIFYTFQTCTRIEHFLPWTDRVSPLAAEDVFNSGAIKSPCVSNNSRVLLPGILLLLPEAWHDQRPKPKE